MAEHNGWAMKQSVRLDVSFGGFGEFNKDMDQKLIRQPVDWPLFCF
jgi:hypothetical protein